MADPLSFMKNSQEIWGQGSAVCDWKWPATSPMRPYNEQLMKMTEGIAKLDIRRYNGEVIKAGGDAAKQNRSHNKQSIMEIKKPTSDQKQNVSTVAYNGTSTFQMPSGIDKRFKSLPLAETLPRNEILGGYIFVCNNDTMQEDLKRQLFGLPQRYRDSVRAIQPGLPLFLYNYTTHQLHGIFEAVSFGGSNIDPTAWEDKKCRGESRFPAQVRIRVRKLCKHLEEDAFRPVLYHYDGPKFRLQLSVPETLELLDLFTENEQP
ncbi:hypothetical protein O6H91_11G047300 [Diphasiastrum complanatum]|uniref:Uncharacterized protein n=2 Tax=Diphasiastrum complanatum TaxID=34168 RepID=A0ACC2C8V7_DIPCM|nr:hypothetical protein O6H91_11G047300 [Diphasiastrum complanatum]KAJ7538426.1 hypothetical protein O6H91_11G047300 [Diphasiastrum complanatum]